MKFTDIQKRLIDICKRAAMAIVNSLSVERSGRCSTKQEKTIESMSIRINSMKCRSRFTSSRKKYNSHLMDRDTCSVAEDIMSYGLEI